MTEQALGGSPSDYLSYMTRYRMTVLVAAALGLVAWLGACSDNPCVSCPPPPPPSGFIASDPIPSPSTNVSSSAGIARSLTGSDNAVYVSLLPGTVPGGTEATVHVVGRVNTVLTSVVDGGFDPVPITANVGDSIEVVLTDAGGAVVQRSGLAVAARRPPVVVRTDPPPKKRDHPLNAPIVVVFSEPVAGSTLTPSTVRLLHGGNAVAGTVTLLQGTAATAVFTPSTPLTANTDYQLVVSGAVRDLGGDVLAAGATVDFTTGTTTVLPANRVAVLPDMVVVMIGSQVQLIVAARDTNGTPVVGRPITWTTENAGVATVSATGLVTGVANGVTNVRAVVDGTPGDAVIQVSATLAPVDSVEVMPASAAVLAGGLVQLTAVLRDAAGSIVRFRPIQWHSSDPAVATVTEAAGGTSVVRGVSAGTAIITATSEGKSGTATITQGPVGPYAQISAGGSHTCAVTTTSLAWCWGGAPPAFDNSGELGNGTTISSLVPSAVAGGLLFFQVSAGGGSCALTPGGAAYCWGSNFLGAVGSGGSTVWPAAFQLTPVAVAGGRQYSTIAAVDDRACGLTTTGAAYCWGYNHFGELGVGTATGPEICSGYGEPCSTVPVAVLGGHTFTAIATGDYHTCALTATGTAYCWGRNDPGALGDSTLMDRYSPVLVAGGLSFTALAAGAVNTCGLTADSTAYCWGANDYGGLGIGTTTGPQGPCQSPIDPNRGYANCSPVPVPVSGGLRFASISAGGAQTCALTGAGAAYCWGNYTATPTLLAGGITFASLSVGGGHSCGITASGTAYCWGNNWTGALGNGTLTDSSVPVKVAGQP